VTIDRKNIPIPFVVFRAEVEFWDLNCKYVKDLPLRISLDKSFNGCIMQPVA
jgi:hypothetical protein